MLPLKHRLTHSDFFLVLKQGQVISGELLRVKRLNFPSTKIGIVVPLNKHRTAVQRNRIKRMLRSCLYKLLTQKKLTGYYIFIFISKDNDVSCEILEQELSLLFK